MSLVPSSDGAGSFMLPALRGAILLGAAVRLSSRRKAQQPSWQLSSNGTSIMEGRLLDDMIVKLIFCDIGLAAAALIASLGDCPTIRLCDCV